MKQILLWALTAVLAAASVYYAISCHFNFGHLCVWILAAVCLLYTVFWRKIDPFVLHTPLGRILLGVLAAGILFFVFVLGVILFGQFGNRAKGDERALIVLGCAVNGNAPSKVLRCRLEAAYAYYAEHPDVTIVVCGGQGPEEDAAEGDVMRAWLIQKGVPQAQILVDDTSTSTEENFRNARALLEAQGLTADAPTAFVTNGFHCYRAAQYARREGFATVRAVPAGLPASQYLTCYVREVFAVVYYWAFKSPNSGFLSRYVGFLKLPDRW
ncbi:MAG: YdcF family protein [Faecalibacterium sp.]|jgi:uncharacterized SAM-binding protein YcdF (DUF218 family)|nr:YdcF family protein [Faecalibacterium sp.]